MAEYLVFRLFGPMCSWGEIAVGESRHTADHPSRSALLGLFAAALGVERADEATQMQLAKVWRFGIKLLSPGTLLRDYHTVQAPRRQGKQRHRTRRDELAAPVVNTLLSTREYRTDSISVVAAELEANTRWTLAGMQAALQHPVFAPYLGRKSCPLALPLAPVIVNSETLREALDSDQLPLAELPLFRIGNQQSGTKASPPTLGPWPADRDQRLFHINQVRYFWEDGMELDPGVSPTQRIGFGAFPAHAGLNRRRLRRTLGCSSVSRTRGAEPVGIGAP